MAPPSETARDAAAPAAGPVQFQAPIGTRDILPPESARWEALIGAFAAAARRSGYGLLQSPLFEDIGVFRRVGEGTDVVKKEMYDFFDKGGRHIALRPEGTASVVRAFNQHHPLPPWKVYYVTPSFRYEAPQKGRYRQHHQLGAEILGTPDPDADVEVITLLWDFYRAVGLRQVTLLVNSMGDLEGRRRYLEKLAAYLRERLGELDAEDRDNVERHPMRVLDSKRAATKAVTTDAPRLVDHLSDDAAARFERVKAGLGAAGIAYQLEPRLVRGFDYYTHTTFEFQAAALDAAQNAIGGGGRYDGLAEALGGDPTPGVGFGAGIERILLACDAEGCFGESLDRPAVFVVDVTDGSAARDLTVELRRAGIGADRAFDGRSMKAQMKAADRSGARLAVIVGGDELAAGTVTLRTLRTLPTSHDGAAAAERQRSVPRAELVSHLKETL
ncbi:MAG: histidine--tRNA ligase [Acidimicrobiales bacterium]